MDQESLNPIFMKALIKYHILQREAKRKVSDDRSLYRGIFKLYKCEQKFLSLIEADQKHDQVLVNQQCESLLPYSHSTSPSTCVSSLRSPESEEYLTCSSSISQSSLERDQRTTSNHDNYTGTDLDIVRKNIWLSMVRKDVIQAYRRRASFKEHKILKSKMIAHRCLSHLEGLSK